MDMADRRKTARLLSLHSMAARGEAKALQREIKDLSKD